MNVRLTFIIFFIFFLNFLLRAETYKRIQLSPTFSFTIKKSGVKNLDLVSLKSKWFQFTSPKTDMPLTLLVLKESPETIANKYSVERYWNQVRSRAKSYL